MDLKRMVTGVLLAVGALLYIGGIVQQGWMATHGGGEIATFLHTAVTTIGAVLGTYFGAVFGIKTTTLRAQGMTGGSALRGAFAQATAPQGDARLQGAAIVLYLVGLLAALVVWLLLGFKDAAPDLIKAMSMTLLGVIGGMLAITLNTPAA